MQKTSQTCREFGVYRTEGRFRMGAAGLCEHFQMTSLFNPTVGDHRFRLPSWRGKENTGVESFVGIIC